jgi:nicotinate phosphoribosyltransferase
VKPVIASLLDTDLYKFTMWQAMLHRHPGTQATYRFTCRNAPVRPLAALQEAVNRELDHLCALTFTEGDLEYLRGLRYFKPDFVDFLRIFRFQRRFIEVRAEGDRLAIEVEGPMVHVMFFELFVLAIVNELYFRDVATPAVFAEGRQRVAEKIRLLHAAMAEGTRRHPFAFVDFGLRRRFSAAWQREIVATLQAGASPYFRGTSNVALARDLGVVPVGTMGHEYLQAYQALGVRLRDSQAAALEDWVREYRGDLGIALTDVIGMDAFLSDFDRYFAKLFDGLRHDSGDAVMWGEKALAHYQQLGVDPHTKTLVFSDGLDMGLAMTLYRHFADRVPVIFGIGTHLTNDLGPEPLQVVMKLIRVNGQPVAKISDSPGKTQCDDPTFLAYLRQVFAVAA